MNKQDLASYNFQRSLCNKISPKDIIKKPAFK